MSLPLIEQVPTQPQRWRVMLFRLIQLHAMIVCRSYYSGAGWAGSYLFSHSGTDGLHCSVLLTIPQILVPLHTVRSKC